MPEGIPKTEEEREETHQELFGESAPKERAGTGDVRNTLIEKYKWEIFLYIIAIIGIICVLFLV